MLLAENLTYMTDLSGPRTTYCTVALINKLMFTCDYNYNVCSLEPCNHIEVASMKNLDLIYSKESWPDV